MKIIAGRQYLLHWKNNPNTWNSNLAELKAKNIVQKYKGGWYTTVTAHFTGDYAIVDCTCDENNGDFHPINTSNLIPF